MILTRLIVNAAHPQGARDLAVPYEFHRTLARAFDTPEGVGYRALHGVLFRIEAMPMGRERTVLVQSDVTPVLDRLPPGYVLQGDSKPYAPEVQAGQVLGFRLLANPVKRPRRGENALDVHVRRQALPVAGESYGASPALEWLQKQGARYGFEVVQVAMEAVAPPSMAEGKGGVPHQGVRFDGRLRVTDEEDFGRALREGVGPAKAFGFGLLSIGP